MARVRGMHKDIAVVVEKLEAEGYCLVRGTDHLKVYGHAGGSYVTTVAFTPRNPWRTLRNLRADVRRFERLAG